MKPSLLLVQRGAVQVQAGAQLLHPQDIGVQGEVELLQQVVRVQAPGIALFPVQAGTVEGWRIPRWRTACCPETE